jgi:hypothetical protein
MSASMCRNFGTVKKVCQNIGMPFYRQAVSPDPVKYSSQQRRKALRAFMDAQKLKLLPWCREAGISRGTVQSFLAGTTEAMGDDTYESLAAGANELLGVDWITAAALRGEEVHSDMVAVAGKIGAGQQVFMVDDSIPGAGIGHVERPPGHKGAIVGAEVDGDSMLPVYRDKDILFYYRDGQGVWTDHIGDEVVVQLTDGRIYVKVLTRGSKRGLATLSSYNAKPIEDVKVDWASPILWIKRAPKYAGGVLPLVRNAR